MEQINMRLSIVVNMYNTASFLPRCLDTLLDQDITANSYEIILVDDGSTDNSLELAQEYAAKSTSDATMPTIPTIVTIPRIVRMTPARTTPNVLAKVNLIKSFITPA